MCLNAHDYISVRLIIELTDHCRLFAQTFKISYGMENKMLISIQIKLSNSKMSKKYSIHEPDNMQFHKIHVTSISAMRTSTMYGCSIRLLIVWVSILG